MITAMKAAFFSSVFYLGPATPGWPSPANPYSDEEAARSLQIALDQFRLADETGWDWVTLAEHHFGPFGLTPNPMVFAGALTQTVRRAKIALLGPTVPILDPIRVAEEYAMLDTMSGGRVVAGFMRGTPNEYVTYNTNPAESRERFEEALLLIRRAWTEKEVFGWQGRHFQYRAVSIWPRPIQAPHPPMFMSGSSPESGTFAAQNRVGLGLAVTTRPIAAKAAQHYREQAALAGWQPTRDDILYRLSFHVADSDEQAVHDFEDGLKLRQRGSPVLANRALEAAVAATGYYGGDLSRQRERNLAKHDLGDRVELGQIVIGSPDTVVAQIRTIAEAIGCGTLDLVCAMQIGERTDKSIALFGDKVLPRIREM
jgi:alkanesulfonate monooxygenase SsuD/methylene tetrahydromethanopterin reductase-like flavin-dependent oxidoreductase (luciferase family)